MAAVAIGYLGYLAYVYHYAYAQQEAILRRVQFNLLSAPQLRYGTITAVDQANSSVQLQFARGLSIRATIPPSGYIGRQDLISENGIYVGALSPVQGTIDILSVGQHFAATIIKDTQGGFIAPMILIGDPL